MTRIIGTIVVLVVVALITGAIGVYSGLYNVAATAHHWGITYAVLDTARKRSIEGHAAGIVAPANLDTQARVVAGTSHFSTHCSVCHSAPGVDAEDMAEGMYPQPPVLTDVSKRFTPAQLFWILKNGIKMSGMPSWADHGDEAMWNIVAFLEELPKIDKQHYAELVKASVAAGGHHMQGGGTTGGMEMGGMKMSPDPKSIDSAPSESQH